MPKPKKVMTALERAVCKYKRKRTLIGKLLEFAEICELEFNLLIYDPKIHKLQEVYSDDIMMLDKITKMKTEMTAESSDHFKINSRILKIESHNAHQKYKQCSKKKIREVKEQNSLISGKILDSASKIESSKRDTC